MVHNYFLQQHLDKRIQEQSGKLINERTVLYNSFMNAPAGISILKGDTHIYEFANAEYEKLVDRKITPGKTVQELFPEVEQQGLIAILNNVFSTGEPFIANEFPVELINKSTGKMDLRYYNSAIQPMKDEKGNIERLLTYGVEVTQQVEARKQIEEANHQLRLAATLTQNIADAVVGTDMDYKTISWNKGAENLYGYGSEEVMGNYAMELLCTQFLSDEDMQAWSKALDATGKWQGEVVQSKKDGTLVSVLVSISYVYDENGKPIAAVAVNRDITERKKAEEKIAASEKQFRTFADSIQSLAWIANADGWINWYNKQWYDYTGSSLEEMQGWGWGKVHHPDHVERVVNFVKEAWIKDETFELTFPLRRHDGEYRWFLTRAYPVKDSNNNIERWIGTNTDIDDQKKALEQKDEFISIASHELKTPVTSLKGFTQILQMKFEKEENEFAAQLLSKMNKQVDKLANLIVELLDATKIENGQLQFLKESFDINDLIIETVEEMQRSAISHKINVELCDTTMITGDRNRIGQVIINLISNAIKYSPEASDILITSVIESNKIKIGVQDHGIGIPASKLENVFDRFFRITGDNRETFPGLGLGLFISKEITKRHNGEIFAESAEGKGSTFCFTLPANVNK